MAVSLMAVSASSTPPLLSQELMVEPAVRGTKYVIDAAAEAKVRRVVFTSSIGSLMAAQKAGYTTFCDNIWLNGMLLGFVHSLLLICKSH